MPASKLKIPLRLAEHLNADGAIDDAAIQQLVTFITESQRLAEDKGATEVMAFATSAIRDATNGDALLRHVMEATGQRIDVLSGEDEARITFLAVRRWFGWSTGRLLVVDIGGGSLELASGSDESPDVAISLPLGAGRLTRTHLTTDPPSDEGVRLLRKETRAAIADVVGRIKRVGEPRIAAATSKTLRQLARIAGAAPSSEGIFVRRTLKRTALDDLVPRLAAMTSKERQELPGVSPSRSGQLVAGAIVAQSAMDLLDIEELVICPWALREGVILHRIDGFPT